MRVNFIQVLHMVWDLCMSQKLSKYILENLRLVKNKGFMLYNSCGLKFNLNSFFLLIRAGLSVKNAWLLSRNKVKKSAIYGYFRNDVFQSRNIQIKNPRIYKYCNMEEIR